MSKVYLLVYSNACGSRDQIKAWAGTKPLVKTWRYDLPNAFYIVSDASANDLMQSLMNFIGRKGRFIITEIGSNRNGLLPTDTWEFFKKHKMMEE